MSTVLSVVLPIAHSTGLIGMIMLPAVKTAANLFRRRDRVFVTAGKLINNKQINLGTSNVHLADEYVHKAVSSAHLAAFNAQPADAAAILIKTDKPPDISDVSSRDWFCCAHTWTLDDSIAFSIYAGVALSTRLAMWRYGIK